MLCILGYGSEHIGDKGQYHIFIDTVLGLAERSTRNFGVLTAEEAGEAQETTSEEIIRSATEQALQILRDMNADRESFRKVGLTFEEKAFYDIPMALRDQYNFEYGTDKVVDGVSVNDKCRSLAKKIKEIIDTKSSFADWLNNQIVRDQLKFDIKVCLIKNGYPRRNVWSWRMLMPV